MRASILPAAVVLAIGGCGNAEPPSDTSRTQAAPRDTVFEPLVGTLDRAAGVQDTVDRQAAEQRRRIEAAAQ